MNVVFHLHKRASLNSVSNCMFSCSIVVLLGHREKGAD